jgi:ATP-binding cassette subfamily D (ALD) protein 3
MREKAIIDDLFESMNRMQRTVYDKLLYFTGCNQFFLKHLLGVVVGWFVIGPGVFTNTKADTLSIQAIANVRAEVGYQFILFIQVMYSAAMGNRLYTAYNKIQGPAFRIVELFQTLKDVSKNDSVAENANFKDGNCIAFKNVDIFTPTGNLLVKNLSFQVTGENDSLLLTGHNGAGKSSIFRCLAGLWKIPTGEITKPMSKANKSSLSGDVFYLPQKPYNVIGTLIDQLTYPAPAKVGDRLSADYIKNILSKVRGNELGRCSFAWRKATPSYCTAVASQT